MGNDLNDLESYFKILINRMKSKEHYKIEPDTALGVGYSLAVSHMEKEIAIILNSNNTKNTFRGRNGVLAYLDKKISDKNIK